MLLMVVLVVYGIRVLVSRFRIRGRRVFLGVHFSCLSSLIDLWSLVKCPCSGSTIPCCFASMYRSTSARSYWLGISSGCFLLYL